jgi:uncharacterized protein DUF4255/IPT/TIG domain-containing protein
MSNALAIAAVTRTLSKIIGDAIKEPVPATVPADVKPTTEIEVSTLPLDKVRDNANNKNQVNLFLYHTQPNAAWRNVDLPRQARPGNDIGPPLGLNLYYLITAYGENNNELIGQFLLGRAMRALHDHALLMPNEISDALAASELHDQIERVRVTPQPLTLDEMSKLWTTFQTQYRTSAAYEVSVVLIESNRRKTVGLPVRAANIYVSTFRRPRIDLVSPQIVQPGAGLIIEGQNLQQKSGKVRIDTTNVAPDKATDQEVQVTLPVGLSAGVKRLQLVQELELGTPPAVHAEAGIESNVAAFVLVPRITTLPPINVAPGANLTLAVEPPVEKRQRVVLLAGDRTINLPARAVTDPATNSSLTFPIPATFPPGQFLLRVQVDGAESLLTTDTDPNSPTFNQYIRPTVTIT